MTHPTPDQAGEDVRSPSEFDRKMTAEDPRYPARKAALEKLEAFTSEWLDDYEWTDGDNGYYTPTEQERNLIADAVHGLHSQQEYVQLHDEWRALCGRALPAPVRGESSLTDEQITAVAESLGYCRLIDEEYRQACKLSVGSRWADNLLHEEMIAFARAILAASAPKQAEGGKE